MAEIHITPEALIFVRTTIRRESMTRPVLSVVWHKGQYQNSRGENGEVVWARTMEPGWYSDLSDWVEHEALGPDLQAELERHCEQIYGMKVFIADEAKKAKGILTVSVKNDDLALEHSEA